MSQLRRRTRVHDYPIWDAFAPDAHRLVFRVQDLQRWRVVGVGL